MVERFLILVLGVSMLATGSATQDRLIFGTGVDLPAQLKGKLSSAASRVGCAADGSITIPANQGKEDYQPELVRIAPNGNLLARIDIQHLPGFSAVDSYDFAPGPDGETYLLLDEGYPRSDETIENGKRKVVAHGTANPVTELLRFSSAGELLSRIQLQPRLRFSKLAVFSSGTILVIGRDNPQEHNPGYLAALLYNPNGTLLRDVPLPLELSAPDINRIWYSPLVPTPIAVARTDEIWLVKTGRNPMLTAVPERGEVLFTSRLKVPKGFNLSNPRYSAGRLFAALRPLDRKVERRYLFATFDPSGGDVTQIALSPQSAWNAICDTSNGMTFIDNEKNTLNVMELVPPEVDPTQR